MSSEVIVALTANGILSIRLAAPTRLNAINPEMMATIDAALDAHLPRTKLVWLSSEGSSFCAGGDMRRIVRTESDALPYIVSTYRLMARLWRLPVPLVTYGKGAIMGGGLGLWRAGSLRLLENTGILSMPEILIGLYPDALSGYFLGRLGALGRFLGVTGTPLSAEDAHEIGWTQGILQRGSEEMLWQAVQNLPPESLNETNIQTLTSPYAMGDLEHKYPILPLFKKELAIWAEGSLVSCLDSLDKLESKHPLILEAKQRVAYGSKLSQCVADRHYWALKEEDIETVCEHETLISKGILAHSDELKEGVRALLIDKDKQPKWRFTAVDKVPQALLDAIFSGV